MLDVELSSPDLLSLAQDQPDPDDVWVSPSCAPGDLATFGPRRENGFWTQAISATAFLRVPAFSTWAKVALLAVVAAVGFALVMRSRRQGVA